MASDRGESRLQLNMPLNGFSAVRTRRSEIYRTERADRMGHVPNLYMAQFSERGQRRGGTFLKMVKLRLTYLYQA